MRNLYCVCRTSITSEYIEVEANSEDEAIELAKLSGNWEQDQTQQYQDFDYTAELV